MVIVASRPRPGHRRRHRRLCAPALPRAAGSLDRSGRAEAGRHHLHRPGQDGICGRHRRGRRRCRPRRRTPASSCPRRRSRGVPARRRRPVGDVAARPGDARRARDASRCGPSAASCLPPSKAKRLPPALLGPSTAAKPANQRLRARVVGRPCRSRRHRHLFGGRRDVEPPRLSRQQLPRQPEPATTPATST